MHTPLRLLLPPAVLLEIDPTPPPPPPPRLPPFQTYLEFLLYFSYLSFLTHADMGKTQDEDIVHAYNLIHSVISDIAIFRENIEKDFHDPSKASALRAGGGTSPSRTLPLLIIHVGPPPSRIPVSAPAPGIFLSSWHNASCT